MDIKRRTFELYRSNRRHLARGGLVLLGTALAIILIIAPIYRRTAREASRLWEGGRRLAAAKELIRRVPDMEAENRRLANVVLYDMDRAGQHISSKLLGAMVAAAQKSQIGFVSVRPMPSRDRSGFFEVPMKIELRAGYHQVGRFLSLVGSEGCIVKVDGFSLAGDRSGSPIVTASIEAKAYFLRTGLGQDQVEEMINIPRAERETLLGSTPYQAKGRDPFLPAGAAEAAVAQATGPAFRLKGIIWDDKKPLATLVDGSGNIYFLRQGERIGTDLLLSIGSNSVVLRRANGAKYELKTWE